jgi:hypothetical protein
VHARDELGCFIIAAPHLKPSRHFSAVRPGAAAPSYFVSPNKSSRSASTLLCAAGFWAAARGFANAAVSTSAVVAASAARAGCRCAGSEAAAVFGTALGARLAIEVGGATRMAGASAGPCTGLGADATATASGGEEGAAGRFAAALALEL